MVLLFIVVLFIVFSFIAYKLDWGEDAESVPGVFAIFFSFAMLVAFGISYTSQIGDIEELNVIEDRIEIYEQRSNNIKNQLKEVLITKYPEHEKSVMKSLSENDASIYLVKYPELHAHETFKQYASTLKSLEDDIYAKSLEKLDLQRNIRERKRNVFYITFLLPTE
ncbi:MAG: hypothetical protein WD512_19010 [Candidatus Paceibacterota bacterium]